MARLSPDSSLELSLGNLCDTATTTEVAALLESGKRAPALIRALGLTGMEPEDVLAVEYDESNPFKSDIKQALRTLLSEKTLGLDIETAASVITQPIHDPSDADKIVSNFEAISSGNTLVEIIEVDPEGALARVESYLAHGTLSWPPRK